MTISARPPHSHNPFPSVEDFQDSYEEYLHRIEETEEYWESLGKQCDYAKELFCATPTKVLVKEAVEFATEWIIMGRCLKFLGKCAQWSISEIEAGLAAKAAKASAHEEVLLCPVTQMLQHWTDIEKISYFAQQNAFDATLVERSLAILESSAVKGCAKKLVHGIERLQEFPGAKKLLQNLLECDNPEIVGKLYAQVEKAITALEEGDEIFHFMQNGAVFELLTKSKFLNRFAEMAKELGLDEQRIQFALENIAHPRVQGDIKVFARAMHEFENVKGGKELIRNVIQNIGLDPKIPNNIGNFGTAKGAYFELKRGLQLMEQSEEIVEFRM